MRINKWLAERTALSRRKADEAVAAGRVSVDGKPAKTGDSINPQNIVTLDGRIIEHGDQTTKVTIMLNKPMGYICSRDGQGGDTIYNLLPHKYHNLESVGRLDKDSSGLLLLTSDGDLHHRLTHPSFEKSKVYQVLLDKPLTDQGIQKLQEGVELEDGLSKLTVKKLPHEKRRLDGRLFEVIMHEGRNRQIRRSFTALGYDILKLHRTEQGSYRLQDLPIGKFAVVN